MKTYSETARAQAIFGLLAFMLFSQTTIASAETSYFEKLGTLFASGTLPEPSKLINTAWAGRCFRSTSPDDPVNAGYLFRLAPSQDVGPIAALNPHAQQYEAASYWNPDQAPDYYDHLSIEQILKAQPSIVFTKVTPTSSSFDIWTDTQFSSSIRVSGSYLIEELSSHSDAGPIAQNNSTVELRCYYFIPEYQK